MVLNGLIKFINFYFVHTLKLLETNFKIEI